LILSVWFANEAGAHGSGRLDGSLLANWLKITLARLIGD
jgi:hypothetical protein